MHRHYVLPCYFSQSGKNNRPQIKSSTTEKHPSISPPVQQQPASCTVGQIVTHDSGVVGGIFLFVNTYLRFSREKKFCGHTFMCYLMWLSSRLLAVYCCGLVLYLSYNIWPNAQWWWCYTLSLSQAM